MLKLAHISKVDYTSAYQQFEKDLELAQGPEQLGTIEASNRGWKLEVVSVQSPPGKLHSRIYLVDTKNLVIKVTNRCSDPAEFSESYLLDLAHNTVLEQTRA